MFEAHLGIALLPKGKRQHALETAFSQTLITELENRVLDFDSNAAAEAATLAAERQKAPPAGRHARHTDRGDSHSAARNARHSKRQTFSGLERSSR